MVFEKMKSTLIALGTILLGVLSAQGEPFYGSQLIEPLNDRHNHGSSVVELPNGDVLVCWYKGSGERTADDVRIVGARLRKGEEAFSEVFEMADTLGFPDCNSTMTIDSEGKLWLFWPLIVANRWETAILMSRYSTDFQDPGAPTWDWQSPILLKPGDRFEKKTVDAIEEMKKTLPAPLIERYGEALESLKKDAADKYARRMGWMPRASPTLLPSGRLILPLYSDGFSFSLVAYTDDNGASWNSSEPILSMGGVQPSIVWKRDGTLVAFMRDNGPPPKRVLVSESKDNGDTWTGGVDSELLDSGAGVEAVRLANGNWVVLHNDLEQGRHSLAAHLSDDDGETWKWVRRLELEEAEKGSFGYPSMHLGAGGEIHATYTYKKESDGPGGTIKYAAFNEEWIREGDPED